jgi:hypothetical protein
MKIKIITDTDVSTLEKKVNGFISHGAIEMVKMDFVARSNGFAVMVTYKSHGYIEETEGIY